MSETPAFMGAYELINRLAAQVGDRDTAIGILRARGHMHPDREELTPAGLARDAMTAAERAVDRASRKTGKPKALFKYNAKTNQATLGPASTPRPMPRHPRPRAR